MILGLDISTSITGFCLLDFEGKYVKVSKVVLSKIKPFLEKCNAVEDELKAYMNFASACHAQITHVYIEDKLSGFSGGTSQQTLIKLSAFNGAITLLSYKVIDYSEPVHIHPSTIKATMKRDGLFIPKGVKGKHKKKFASMFLANICKEFPYEETKMGNLKAGVDDQADAFFVARTGYLKFIQQKMKS